MEYVASHLPGRPEGLLDPTVKPYRIHNHAVSNTLTSDGARSRMNKNDPLTYMHVTSFPEHVLGTSAVLSRYRYKTQQWVSYILGTSFRPKHKYGVSIVSCCTEYYLFLMRGAGDESLKTAEPSPIAPVRLACQTSLGQVVVVLSLASDGHGTDDHGPVPAAGSPVSMFRHGWCCCFIIDLTMILECTQPGSSCLICRAPWCSKT